MIDGYPTVAEYVNPDEGDNQEIITKSSIWHAKHVQESQYFLQIIKCKDTACCSPPRSSYFSLVKDRFLPPPLPLAQTNDGLCCSVEDSNARYPSLFVHMALDKSVLPARAEKKFSKGLPYDFSCPSIQTVLPRRICGHCGKYFASIRSLKDHGKDCIEKANSRPNAQTGLPVPRVRPQRLAAKRQRELMCVLTALDNEEYEWHDEDDVDYSGLVMPPQRVGGTGTPLLPVGSRQPVWQDN